MSEGEFDDILDQLSTVRGEDRFGVKLHAEGAEHSVLDRHRDSGVAVEPGGHFQCGRKVLRDE